MASGHARGVRHAVLFGLVAVLVTACATAPASPGIAVLPASPAGPATDVFRDGAPVSRDGEPGLWLAWSLLDTRSGRAAGSANAATERTNAESSIKAWIAVDTLRAAAAEGRPVTVAERGLIRRAVRSSDDDAAETLYRRLGADAVLDDLRSACGVPVETSRRGYWSFAQITAADAVATLACVVRLAPSLPGGAELVEDLRAVEPDGRSGIASLLPAGVPVVEKNGWTYHSGTGWNVNCVVAWDRYVLSVLTRFPGERPEQYGWGVCRDVARDVLAGLA